MKLGFILDSEIIPPDLVALLTTDSNKGGLASTLNHVSLGFEASAFSVNDWDQIGAPLSKDS